jgi:hypothetical protein
MAQGRLSKAVQFWQAAEIVREFADAESDVGDAYVTLAVHAGIAASDAICCVALGRHSQDDDRHEAVQLLGSVRPDGAALSSALSTLLGIKTKAGYSHRPVNADDRRRAQRQAEKLVTAARERFPGG